MEKRLKQLKEAQDTIAALRVELEEMQLSATWAAFDADEELEQVQRRIQFWKQRADEYETTMADNSYAVDYLCAALKRIANYEYRGGMNSPIEQIAFPSAAKIAQAALDELGIKWYMDGADG